MIRLERAAVATVLTAFFCLPVYLISFSGGPPPGRSGGPFPGEQSCAAVGCHGTDALNAGDVKVSFTIDGAPPDNYTYTAGQAATIQVRVEDSAQQRWGFEMTARSGDGCQGAGEFTTADTQIQTFMSRAGDCGDNMVPIAEHSFPKTGSGGATFEITWTPAEGQTGPVTLAVAGNAANGNGTNTGDHIGLASAVIQPEQVNPPTDPVISEGGAVLATQTPVIRAGSGNAILSVFGTGFAPAGTMAFDPQVDDNGDVATTLANTCVEVNGRRSPIFAVTETQVNFQASDQTELGPAMVQVIGNCGGDTEAPSNTVSLDFQAASPGFFNFVNNADGANPIAATSADGTEFIGPADIFGGNAVTRPAHPGEVIVVYATGFGPTDPPFVAGQIPGTETGEIDKTQMTLMFGDFQIQPAEILYAGVSPCCAGLYQLAFPVPAAATEGNHKLIATVRGVTSADGPFIAVAPE